MDHRPGPDQSSPLAVLSEALRADGATVIRVPVSTVWADVQGPRPVDAPIVASRPNLFMWAADMDHSDRLGLVGRVETQALMWEPATPLERSGEWVRVALPLQPDATGAPLTGWVIADHLTSPTVDGPHRWIVVTERLAPARGTHGWVALSIGTLMPAGPAHASTAHVLTPDGQQLTLDPVHVGEADSPEPSPSALAVAAKWLAVPYLWGGLSGHGVDCSGLVHVAARTLGHVFPRNAADQSQRPRSPFAEPLHFYYDQSRRRVRHVAIALDATSILHAPRTGRTVEIIRRADDPNEPDRAWTLSTDGSE